MTSPGYAAALAATAGTGGGLALAAYRTTYRRIGTATAHPAWLVIPSAALTALVTIRLGFTLQLPAYAWLAATASPLALYDLTTRRLPNVLVLPSAVVVPASLITASLLRSHPGALLRLLISSAVAALVFTTLYALGLGAGDVKLGTLLLGAAGWLGYTRAFTAFLTCFLLAAAAVLGLRALRHPTAGQRLPLGPFLFAGFFVATLLP